MTADVNAPLPWLCRGGICSCFVSELPESLGSTVRGCALNYLAQRGDTDRDYIPLEISL